VLVANSTITATIFLPSSASVFFCALSRSASAWSILALEHDGSVVDFLLKFLAILVAQFSLVQPVLFLCDGLLVLIERRLARPEFRRPASWLAFWPSVVASIAS